MRAFNSFSGTFLHPAAVLLAAFFASMALCVAAAAQTNVACNESGLRSALDQGGSYTFNCSGTITITNTMVVAKDATLDGSSTITLSGGNSVRLFTVNPGVKLTLLNLTLADGTDAGADGTNGDSGIGGSGAAIYNNGGILTLVNCVNSNHTVSGGNGGNGIAQLSGSGGKGGNGGSASGGAIFNNGGTLLLTNCMFVANAAIAGEGGNGADAASGGNGNYAGAGGVGGSAAGGAIYNSATGIVITYDCTFTSNYVVAASGGGGGNGTGLGSNGANGSPGAGLSGGVYNDGGTVTVLFSTFNGNSADGADGGAGKPGAGEANGSGGTPGSAASGGGIVNNGGSLFVTNCTFYANYTVGGDGGDGGDGGTFGFGGNGGNGGAGGAANGGAVFNTANGSTLLVNCTISDNNAQGGAGGSGGAAGSAVTKAGHSGASGANNGGGIASGGGTITLVNTLVGYTTYGGNGAGVITDGGHNLSDDASIVWTVAGSSTTTNLNLGVLADNGGKTPTVAVLSGSAAIDAGDDSACLPVDQRHMARYGPCDIGAYEFGAGGPVLNIRLQTNQVVLSWTTAVAGYALQSSTNLLPTSWIAVSPSPSVVSNQFVVTNNADGVSRYYRLVK